MRKAATAPEKHSETVPDSHADAVPDQHDAAPPPPEMPAAMDLDSLQMIWAPAALLVDKPAKLIPEVSDEYAQDNVVDGLLSLMGQARREVLIVSPYF